MKSRDGASISRLMGLCLGRATGGPAAVSPDCNADCAIAELATRVTTIAATEVGMTARKRSRDIRDHVDHETDDCRNEQKRKDRMQQGDAADSHRGYGN